MKKIVCMLLMCLTLLCGAAMAEEIPAKVLAPLQGRFDAGYTIAASYYHPGNSRAHFVLTRNGRNQLAIVHLEDGEYELELLATDVLRQGSEIPELDTDDDYYLVVFYRDEDGTEDSYTYHYESNGKWMLSAYSFGMGEHSWRSFAAKNGCLTYHYYENNEQVRKANIYGSFQREAKYLNIENLPATLEEARMKLSQPPEIPDGGLTAQNVKFTSGMKYAVYSGPGEDYLRAANGKASVSTNDWIQVFGVEDGWALIQYDISSSQMRFGYIDASALPKNADVAELDFQPVNAYTTRRATITDDPLNTQWALATLHDGAWVTWLATMGEWAYVESTTGDAIRGFVPVNALSTHRVFDLSSHRLGGNEAVLSGTLTVQQNGTVLLLVDGWVYREGQSPLRFEVYNETTNQLIFTANMDSSGAYRGSGQLGEDWGVRICPVYEEGAPDVGAATSVQW